MQSLTHCLRSSKASQLRYFISLSRLSSLISTAHIYVCYIIYLAVFGFVRAMTDKFAFNVGLGTLLPDTLTPCHNEQTSIQAALLASQPTGGHII